MAVTARVDVEGGDAAYFSTRQADIEVGPLVPSDPYLLGVGGGVEVSMLSGGAFVAGEAGEDSPPEGGVSQSIFQHCLDPYKRGGGVEETPPPQPYLEG